MIDKVTLSQLAKLSDGWDAYYNGKLISVKDIGSLVDSPQTFFFKKKDRSAEVAIGETYRITLKNGAQFFMEILEKTSDAFRGNIINNIGRKSWCEINIIDIAKAEIV